MSIYETTPVRPNQRNQEGPLDALTIAEYSGMVETSLERASAMSPYISMHDIKGTDTLTSYAVGETTAQILEPGKAPDGTPVSVSNNSVKVKTTPMTRNIISLLEDFQTKPGVRAAIGSEQGKTLGRLVDRSILTMGIKTALLEHSPYANADGSRPEGFHGGSQVVLASPGDENDPAALYDAIGDLAVQMEEKDVDPQTDNMFLVVPPRVFYDLQRAEQIANGDYLTAQGNQLSGVPMFKAYNVPVISTNNLPTTNVTDSILGANYNVDASDIVALMMSPRAILAGSTIPLQSDVWFNKHDKQHYVDSFLAFGLASDRAEFAGVIKKNSA